MQLANLTTLGIEPLVLQCEVKIKPAEKFLNLAREQRIRMHFQHPNV